jgi:hypothetical protein
MELLDLIQAIGWSHLLQPPLTMYLASDHGLALKRCIRADTEVARGVLFNMGIASIALPTSLGLLLAHHAHGIRPGDAAASLAWLIAAFWSWRLYRQCRIRGAWARVRSGWDRRSMWPWWLLAGVFLVQGPVLGVLLAWELL